MSSDYDLPEFLKPLVDLLNGGQDGGNVTVGFADQAASTQSPITQLYLSLSIGTFSVVLFCILRLKWPAMYAARSRLLKYISLLSHSDPFRSAPPKLGNSFFGWLVPLYRIKESEVLKLVGFDALMVTVSQIYAKI